MSDLPPFDWLDALALGAIVAIILGCAFGLDRWIAAWRGPGDGEGDPDGEG